MPKKAPEIEQHRRDPIAAEISISWLERSLMISGEVVVRIIHAPDAIVVHLVVWLIGFKIYGIACSQKYLVESHRVENSYP